MAKCNALPLDKRAGGAPRISRQVRMNGCGKTAAFRLLAGAFIFAGEAGGDLGGVLTDLRRLAGSGFGVCVGTLLPSLAGDFSERAFLIRHNKYDATNEIDYGWMMKLCDAMAMGNKNAPKREKKKPKKNKVSF